MCESIRAPCETLLTGPCSGPWLSDRLHGVVTGFREEVKLYAFRSTKAHWTTGKRNPFPRQRSTVCRDGLLSLHRAQFLALGKSAYATRFHAAEFPMGLFSISLRCCRLTLPPSVLPSLTRRGTLIHLVQAPRRRSVVRRFLARLYSSWPTLCTVNSWKPRRSGRAT